MKPKIAVALAAMLAMSAVAVSSASALEYKSTVNPVMLYGEDTGNHSITVDSQSTICTKAVFEKASQGVPTKEITGINAAYSGCTLASFAATVNMGSCTYTFKEPNRHNPNNEPDVFTAHVALICPNNPMTINSNFPGSECSVSIGNTGNGTLAHLLITVDTTSGHYLVDWTVNGITAVKNKDNGFCPFSGTGTIATASINGPTTVEGTAFAKLSIS